MSGQWSMVSGQWAAGGGQRGGSGRRRRGFTLIELLVVIAIIVTLIAILLPALGRSKQMAYVTATRSLLSNLSSQCESYYTMFHAYPGPMPPIGNGFGTTLGTVTGAQNLLLGLSYGIRMPPLTPGSMPIPGFVGATVDPTTPSGPYNWAIVQPNGLPEQTAPFFSPTAKQISKSGTPGGFPGATGSTFPFPVIVDAFPDALPVLYYRRSPGVDGTGVMANGAVSTQGTPAIAAVGPAAPGNIASYYFDDNKAYTGSTLTSMAGTACPQIASSGTLQISALTASDLATLASTGPANGTATATGGYVLIAAGKNRAYGRVKTATDSTNRIDAIVQTGGQ